MRYMDRYISKLLTMNSPVFFRFLDSSCKRFQFRLLGTLRKDTVFLLKPTQYINQTTFMSSFTQEVSSTGSIVSKMLPCLKKAPPALPPSEELAGKHLSTNLKKSSDPTRP